MNDLTGDPPRPAGSGPELSGSDGADLENLRRTPMTAIAWTLLVVAGLLEIVWAIALKQADGFTRLWPSVMGVTLSLVSFLLLAFALRQLAVGTAYAVWVGIGAVGVTIAGIVYYGEPASTVRLLCIALILAGVIGLRITGG